MSHLGYEPLQLHVVNAPMDRYEGQTVLTDVDPETAHVQLYNLIVRLYLEPESTGHRHLAHNYEYRSLNLALKHSSDNLTLDIQKS